MKMKPKNVQMYASDKEIPKNEKRVKTTKWNPNGPKLTILRSNSNGLRMKITAIQNNNKLTEESFPVNNNNNHKNNSNHYHQIESTDIEKAYVVSHPSSLNLSPSITPVDLCLSCTTRTTETEGKSISKSSLQRKSQYSPKQQKRNHSNQKGECKSKSLLSPGVVSRTSMQAINKSKNSQTKKLNSNTSSQIKNINNHDSSVAIGCNIVGGPPGGGTGIITQTGESISSSDTELPALVSAAIKCVEDCSETENLSSEEVVDPKYTCSLLHDFMLKTEMVGASIAPETKMKRKSSPAVGSAANQIVQPVSVASTTSISNEKKSEPIEAIVAPVTKKSEIKAEIMTKKQERLEKKKNKEENAKKKISSKKGHQQMQQNQNHPSSLPVQQSSSSDPVTTIPTTTTTTVSPPVTEVAKKEVVDNKTTTEMPLASSAQKEIRTLSSFTNIGISDKHHFNSEKILYPPGGRKASSSSNKHETSNKIVIKPDVDPLWRKIDVNSKFNRPKIAGYKTDGVTPICSKIIAAKSGYLSDVGSGGLNRNSSGYKSDFSARSRSSTIYSRAKSCDFRRVLEHKSKKLRYKRRAIVKQSKSINSVSEQDILQLAGLSLEQTNHKPAKPTLIAASAASAAAATAAAPTTTTTASTQTNIPILPKTPNSISISSKMKEIDRFIRTGEYFSLTDKSKTTMTTTTTTTTTVVETPPPPEINIKPHKRCRDDDTTYDKFHKAKSYYKSTHNNGVSSICRRIQSRRYSMISHCSSISTTSKFRSRRRKRQKLKGNRKYCIDSTLSLEIDLLSHLFSFMCLVETDKSSPRLLFDDKAREKLLIQKFSATRILKKRKLIDVSDYDTTSAMAKRRYKKMLHTSSPDEHKLPLKKRHYSLSTGEKYECKSIPSALDLKLKDISDTKCMSKSIRHSIDKQFMKLCSQKKNHNMLESSCSGINKTFSSRKSRSSMCSELRNVSSSDGEVKTKTDLLTKKKRRLEMLVSKLYPSEKSSTDGVKSITPNMMEYSDSSVPSTVFQPTVKLNYSGIRTLDAIQTEPAAAGGSSSAGNHYHHHHHHASQKYTTSNNVKNFQTEQMSETADNNSSHLILVKNKRRRAINRTGFPSVKKRKKKENSIINNLQSKMEKLRNNHISSPSSYLCSSDKVAIKKENSSGTASDNNESKLSIISRGRLCATPIKNNSVEGGVSNTTYSIKQGTTNSTRNRKHDLLIQLEKTAESYLENQPVVKLYNANIDFKNFSYSDSQIDDCSLQDRIDKAKSTRNVRDRNKNIKKIPIIKKIERPRRLKLNQDDEKKESPAPSPVIPNSGIKVRATKKTSLRAMPVAAPAAAKVKNNIATPAKNNRSKRNISAIKQADEIEHDPLPLSEKTEETDEDNIQKSDNRTIGKTKKTYISAGLFSSYYKVNTRTRKAAPEKLSQSMKYPNKPSNSILPPPLYCENFFRKSNFDFQLPYELWWAYINAKLPIRVPSWNYRKIRTNIYGDVRPNSITDHQACNCKHQTGCKEDCLNRMVYTECSPTNCPCGEKCENQKIQKHDIAAGIERFMTKDKGWGVRTNLPITKGTYIMEYVGEVVTEREFKQRMATLYANDTHHYCLHLDGVLVIDGHRMGSDGRFVNHSCTPNCEMQKWSVNGLFRMALFALRDIESGEELTYDYNFSLFNPSEGQPCKCDTPHCRGVIGGKSQRIKLPENLVPMKAVSHFSQAEESLTNSSYSSVGFNFSAMQTSKQPMLNPPVSKRYAKRPTSRCHLKELSVDQEKSIAKGNKCFLIRNLEKNKKQKGKLIKTPSESDPPTQLSHTPPPPFYVSTETQVSTIEFLQNMKSKNGLLRVSSRNSEIGRVQKIANLFRQIGLGLENIKEFNSICVAENKRKVKEMKKS